MTPAELRREAREAEAHYRYRLADRLRRRAAELDAEQGHEPDPDDLSGLTVAELARIIDAAAERVMAASAELFRRQGDEDNEKEATR